VSAGCPFSQRTSLADGRSPAGEDEERGLKRVLGIVAFAQGPPANTPAHGPVSLHSPLEGKFIAQRDEAFQESSVAESARVFRPRQLADV